MKKIITIAIILILVLCIILGLFLFHEKGPYAYIILKNDSNKNIKIVKLIDERKVNNQIIEHIKNRESKKIKFHVVGSEAGYPLEVTFEDNSTITGGAGYIEKGYRIIETIKSSKIESNTKLFGL